MSEQIGAQNINFEQTTEYLIFHNLETFRHKRQLARWPLHITVVPSFRIPDGNEDALRSLVHEVAADYRPILLYPGEDALFGPNNDVPVTKVIDIAGELQDLHMRFLWDLGSIACNELDATYAGTKYTPHFTLKRGVFPPTTSFALDALSIAKKSGDVRMILETTSINY